MRSMMVSTQKLLYSLLMDRAYGADHMYFTKKEKENEKAVSLGSR